MRYCATLLFVCLLSSVISGQSRPEIDSRLNSVYEADFLERVAEENPFLIQRWNFYLDHSWFIREVGDKKYPPSKTIIIEDLTDFNIMEIEQKYELERGFDKQSYYFIENTDKVLIFYAETHFSQMLNKHLGRSHSTK